MQTNAIYCGDCQNVLGNTVEFPDGSVDLIYIDPPFFSNKHYEVLWGDGYELRAFADRWKGGVENYIAWMDGKLRECYRVLKENGTMYLHCDWHANAHLRILMDKIFGESHFRNEIAWCYSGGGIPRSDFPRKHDTIFRYVKGTDPTFNTEYRRYSQGIVPTHSTGEALDLKRGTPVTDWWTDIKIVTPYSAKRDEKLGYPTQKPEDLLKRIIKVSSNEGDVVLDAFCGCGTAIAVAHKEGRKWVGIDVSPTACKLMAKRMHSLGLSITEADIRGLPKTEAQLRAMEPFEFQNWVLQRLMGRVSAKKTGDLGIDGRLFDGSPVQVKQSEGVGRNVIDNFNSAILREKKTKGLVVALSFGSGAFEEVARLKNEGGVEITLKTLKELMEEE
jgi:DNA modification methylase